YSCVSFLSVLSCLSLSITVPFTTQIYTLSLHDALPIFVHRIQKLAQHPDLLQDVLLEEQLLFAGARAVDVDRGIDALFRDQRQPDRKSTRLNSSHVAISYAVFCLKKKKKQTCNKMHKQE